jgi:hypothetical protein
MISTISGELAPAVSFSAIIKATFPMGSMTGAPKQRVMQLIDQYEQSRRGIFSGAVGYISPDGDFDFNVVIRSIMYNAVSGYLSFQAGSAITYYSDPEKEWEECVLKAAAIKNPLGERGGIIYFIQYSYSLGIPQWSIAIDHGSCRLPATGLLSACGLDSCRWMTRAECVSSEVALLP